MPLEVLWAAFLCWVTASPSAEVSLNASADPSDTEVGKKIVYSVTATYPPGTVVNWPSGGGGLEDFQIQDFQLIQERKAAGGKRESGMQYVLNTFVSGDYVIPALSVPFSDQEGLEGVAKTPSIFIHVRSPEVGPQDELKDIASPVEVRGQFPLWIGGVACGGLVFIAALVLFWLRRRRRPRQIPSVPVWEQALSELETLQPGAAVSQGEWKALYVSMSWILRRYLEGRFAVLALEETTDEIEEGLRTRAVSGTWLPPLREVLSSCDLVKYAKQTPTIEDAENLHQRAMAWVKETIPAPEVEAAA